MIMASRKPSKDAPKFEFINKADLVQRFSLWKQRIKLFAKTEGIRDQDLSSYIQQALDDDGLKIYNSFRLSEENAANPEHIFKQFEDRLNISKPNFRAARLDLHFFYQKPDETLDDFYTRCREKANDCSFSDDEVKERFIEQLLASTPIEDFRKWLLSQEETIDIDGVLAEGRKQETTVNSIQHIAERNKLTSAKDTSNIDAIKHKKIKKQPKSKCFNCGGDHQRGKQHCPAKDTECYSCKTKGHWSKVCRKTQDTSRPHYKKKQVHHVAEQQDSDTESEEENIQYNVVTISIAGVKTSVRKEVFANIQVQVPGHENKPKKRHFVNMKIDTGAMGNTLPLRVIKKMKPDQKHIKATKGTRLIAYNDTEITCHGYIEMPCRHNDGDWVTHRFYIVDVPGPAACGLPMSEALGLVTVNCSINIPPPTSINSIEDLKKQYPEQFDRIGKLPGKVKLYLIEGAVPSKDPPRKCSIHIRNKLKSELDRMESLGIISKVREHADWHSSLVTSIKKDGSLRVCLDPKKLNQALRRSPHKMMTLEEASYKFNGAKLFSKLDAKAGYWSVELEDASQILTTFRTPFGKYKFKRLPFGLSVSQDLYQEKIDHILENCPGTIGMADDIAVFGKTEEEHDQNLITLLNEAKKNGLVFNSGKCTIKQSQIEYFGMIFSSAGMKPDHKKIADLKAIPPPTSKTELQEFLGLVTFLGPFIPNLSAQAEPIRALLKKDVPFQWEDDHQQVFEHIKTLVGNETYLKYYDTEAPTYLMVDASQRGLGAALLQPDRQANGTYTQEAKPVAFASKALSKSQKNYVNIEREMLAITFGIKRFHTYLYNRHFTVISDHKPLEMICNKPILAAPPRLQAMMLAVQDYDYKVKYVPGKDIGLADTLSRLPNLENSEDVSIDIRIEHLHFTDTKLTEIRSATTTDPALNELREVIFTGWPNKQQELPTSLRSFWSYRDELSIDDGLIMKGDRVFIPQVHRKSILQNLHTGHMGITKTQLRAKRDVYWPRINEDIEKMCKECAICEEPRKSQQSESMIPTDTPSRPWSVIGTDLFQIGDDTFLMIADYYTKFPLVDKLPKQATSEAVANIMKRYCCIFGIPDIVRSDNGPQYVGQAFAKLTEEYGFRHITSSPKYPQSNGFVERHIGTVKPIMKKAMAAGEDWNLALLRLRTTPLTNKLDSPAELMFQRRIRDSLPTKIRNTDPDRDQVRHQLRHRQEVQKAYHDRNTRDLPPLIPGQQATFQDTQTHKWLPAVVKAKAPQPRSYIIETPTGQTLRRNRVQLRDSHVARTSDDQGTKSSTQLPSNSVAASSADASVTNKPPCVTRPPPATPPNSTSLQAAKVTSRSGREIRIPSRYQN
jgi:hypothetical protein